MKLKNIIGWILLLTAAVALGCDANDYTSLAGHYGDDLQAALQNTLDAYHGPGAVLAVSFNDGSSWIGTAGVAQLPDEAMSAADHFRMGSVTKTFTGEAVLLLAQSGALTLEDTLDVWLGRLVPDGEGITVRNLLDHTSGLFDFTWSEEDYVDRILENPTGVWLTEELIAIANENGPIAAPGEAAVYSNTNYVLLGLIIEAVSGQKAEAFIADNILTPLALDETTFPTTAAMPAPYTHGYLDVNGDGLFTADEDFTAQHPSAIWTAGAMISTPADLLVWLAELNDSTLLDEQTQAERLNFARQVDGFPAGYFGLGIVKLDGGVGHTGALMGYQTVILRYRDADFVVYSNGYLTSEGVNITNKIYAAAVEVVYPGSNVEI
ncbi:MAG TPA: serine hydrolase domain-containing protein [bacterium]|nr:serine hydrolase domain-containing protein [bacterium]